ncbi:5-methyltetrahydropteroyltriglutamate--homocysteine S-methyltransferase [Janthinobacterium rivuli]|uniref:5-methyltetrahydropteroyltriglutamate-- homocysteine S-methyltransferase n=1 Tax=Janthinobacterium rivuli TaxID=2751478 RepID=UPI00383A0A44
MTIRTHTLGFPRIGATRELTLALESHWRGEVSEAALEVTGQQLRARHWALQRDAGLDYVTVGDFALYDQVANHIQLLGCEPARFNFAPEQSPLARYFTMARGEATHAEHADCGPAHAAGTAALEMSKWFDTNYHYLVPELSPQTQFSLACERLLAEVAEAQALGHQVKAALIGPLTFLWLGKEKTPGFDHLALLEQLLPVYGALLDRLKQQGVAWVQIDEPILGLDLPSAWRNAFESTYWQLNQVGINILLATYFSPLEENLSLTCRLPVAGLHVDGIRAPHELISVTDWLPAHKVLSIGIVDGRNIWRTDLDAALAVLQPLAAKRNGHLWLAPSCSLLHVPFSLEAETELDGEIRTWLAFATEKLAEIAVLKDALEGHPDDSALAALATSRQAIASRRASHKRGELGSAEYEAPIRAEIAHAVGRQEALGLDVLVHGEAERNDMVDYFGEQLDGFIFTRHGWVQSYGSRCVKPPVIYSDVQRPAAMTVAWTVHAQSLTNKPVKGMLTGPVTILQCSFVRDDQPRAATALQLALAIRDEVQDLETAGFGIIQIDEPAIREGLPLRRSQWDAWLDWATRAYRIAVIPPAQLRVNPDCGLKTRGGAETEAALKNILAAARQMRAA